MRLFFTSLFYIHRTITTTTIFLPEKVNFVCMHVSMYVMSGSFPCTPAVTTFTIFIILPSIFLPLFHPFSHILHVCTCSLHSLCCCFQEEKDYTPSSSPLLFWSGADGGSKVCLLKFRKKLPISYF